MKNASALIAFTALSFFVAACSGTHGEESKTAFDYRVGINKEGKVALVRDAPLEPDEKPYCTYLDSRRRFFGWVAAGAGVLAGGGVAFAQSIDDNDKNSFGKATLSGSFLVLGAVAGVAAYLTADYGQTAKAHGCITISPADAAAGAQDTGKPNGSIPLSPPSDPSSEQPQTPTQPAPAK